MNISAHIAKEEIAHVRFSKNEVLHNDALKQERRFNLLKAERLGNAYHGKVFITFAQENGDLTTVNTTVWATCTDHIVLKSGITIPVSAISQVEF